MGRRAGGAVLGVALLAGTAACTSASSNTSNASGTSPAAAQSTPTAVDTANIVPKHSTLTWHSCPTQGNGVECTMLSVPLNYQDPGGRQIQLALSMAPATAPVSQQQGIMLVNPGGPGGDGLPLAAEVQQGLNPAVAADYDIVGFDPRGVGSSVPALSCDPSFFKGPRQDYIPANQAQEQELENRAKAYAQDCEKKFGWLLPYMTTIDVAHDVDKIREAFGVSQINYYAFSYGTYIGEVYATLFPKNVRRMVLDSTVDPTGVWYQDNLEQDYAFQGRMEAFFAWTAKYDSTYNLGSTQAEVQASWYKARAKLKKDPVNGTIGPDEYDDTFLMGGYLDNLWPGFAQALSSYLNEDQTSDLVTQYQQWGTQVENEFAVYNAVQCSDVNWPRSWATWNADVETVDKTAPFQAWDNTWFNAACAFWPVKGPSEPLQINGSGLPPILMLQGTLDPATPYAGAQNAHKLLPSARMVVVTNGGNHGQSLEDPPNTCVQNYLNDYLGTGAVPDGAVSGTEPGLVNATCPVVPPPTPGE